MENVIASYLKEIWGKKDWIFEVQHGFQPGFSCESQVIRVCQDIADSLDSEGRTDTIIIDFSKAFNYFSMIDHLEKLQPQEWIWG
jgi:hypothetical protein